MTRRTLILAPALAACRPGARATARARAIAWLVSQQAEDGGWHSLNYGLLRPGHSLTAFVLDAVAQEAPDATVKKAVAFLQRNIDAEGCLGCGGDAAADYPNYATALAVSALRRCGQPVLPRMLDYLRAQQFTEQNGWQPSHPAYGAWGMGGTRRRAPDAGHVDLSMTRFVLEAAPSLANPAAITHLGRLQNPDGGFLFSLTEEDTNKAGPGRSYGTATADGILALLAAGVAPTDARIQSAWRWLREHHTPDRIPGFTGPAYERWHAGLRFYYPAVLAQAARALGEKPLPVTLPPPRADGSFANPENLVKEDDPLIASALFLRS